MNSEHHWLDKIFLKDLMFDDFKAKSWSDAKDQEDLERAKESSEYDEDCQSFAADDTGAYEAVKEFAYLWIDAYYADYGFNNGLIQFKIEKWGDDGLDLPCFEIELFRNDKPFYTLYIGLQKRLDGKWGISEVLYR